MLIFVTGGCFPRGGRGASSPLSASVGSPPVRWSRRSQPPFTSINSAKISTLNFNKAKFFMRTHFPGSIFRQKKTHIVVICRKLVIENRSKLTNNEGIREPSILPYKEMSTIEETARESW